MNRPQPVIIIYLASLSIPLFPKFFCGFGPLLFFFPIYSLQYEASYSHPICSPRQESLCVIAFSLNTGMLNFILSHLLTTLPSIMERQLFEELSIFFSFSESPFLFCGELQKEGFVFFCFFCVARALCSFHVKRH